MPANARVGGSTPGRGGFHRRPETLSSRENSWLKRFRAALRGSGPDDEGWAGIEGARLVEDALRSGLETAAILASASGERHLERLAHWLEPAAGLQTEHRPRLLQTSDRLFASVSGTETPQGIAALVRPRAFTFDDLLRGDVPLIVVLVGVQDPGNVGTVLRSAEAFGATGAIATRGTASPWAPKVLRASAGSALRLPIIMGAAEPVALVQLKMAKLRILAATAGGGRAPSARTPQEIDFRGPLALLVGNEGAGLPGEIERAADELVRIPIADEVESLNAAVAASVLLYEAARQRSQKART
jgi:TrmH family RNA methyltransferase